MHSAVSLKYTAHSIFVYAWHYAQHCSRPHLLKVCHVHRLLHVILAEGPAKQIRMNVWMADCVNIW